MHSLPAYSAPTRAKPDPDFHMPLPISEKTALTFIWPFMSANCFARSGSSMAKDDDIRLKKAPMPKPERTKSQFQRNSSESGGIAGVGSASVTDHSAGATMMKTRRRWRDRRRRGRLTHCTAHGGLRSWRFYARLHQSLLLDGHENIPALLGRPWTVCSGFIARYDERRR